MTCKLTAIIEQDKDGVFAYCPELKDCLPGRMIGLLCKVIASQRLSG